MSLFCELVMVRLCRCISGMNFLGVTVMRSVLAIKCSCRKICGNVWEKGGVPPSMLWADCIYLASICLIIKNKILIFFYVSRRLILVLFSTQSQKVNRNISG